MPTVGYAHLSCEEDQELRKMENNTMLREKVTLRARVIRLSQRKTGASAIAEYTERNYRSIRRALERWEGNYLKNKSRQMLVYQCLT